MTLEFNNSEFIESFLYSLSDKLKDSLKLLVIPDILEDSLAKAIITKAGKTERESSQLIKELKRYPIWHERTISTWIFDEDIRRYIKGKMDNSTVHREMVLSVMKEYLGKIKDPCLYEDYYIQIARLSLTIDESMKEGVAALREIFDATVYPDQLSMESVSEVERVIDLYLGESFSGNENYGTNTPEELLSVYFMRGLYAYKTKRYDEAKNFLSFVWKQGSNKNPETIIDASVAAHLMGVMLSENESDLKYAKDAFYESIQLSITVNIRKYKFPALQIINNLNRVDLSGIDLSGVDLSEAELEGANLSGAKLIGANLSGAKLMGADLSGAKLMEANLDRANLKRAKLMGADLSRAKLMGANLSGKDLIRTEPSYADKIRAVLSYTYLIRSNLEGADLSVAKLSEANLNGADLSGANLEGAKLIGADLSGADLSGVKLSEAKLSGADVIRSYLSSLERTNLSRVDLFKSLLSSLERTNPSEDDVIKAILETDLSKTYPDKADLREAKKLQYINKCLATKKE